MGWNSAGEIFEAVADEIVGLGIDDEDVTAVLSSLILALQSHDWDTEDESLEVYKHVDAVVEAFAERGIVLPGKRCPHCDGLLEEHDAG